MNRVVAAVIAALVAVPLSIPVASAEGSLAVAEEAAAQELLPDGHTVSEAATAEALDVVVARVLAITDRSGFANVAIDIPTKTVTVRWKGDQPSELAALTAQVLDGGIRVVVMPAVYSEDEIMDAGTLLRSEFAGEPWRPTLWHGTPERDALIVGVPKSALDAVGENVLKERFEQVAGMPVQVVLGDLVPLSRQDDASNWSGGAGMIKSTGGYCSTGFAVLDGAYGRLLSAAHCDTTGNTSWYDGTGSDIFTYGGSYVDVHQQSWDSLLIDPVGGTQGKVYVGPWYSTTKRSVAAASPTADGDSVCTSGANSGEHCGTVIDRQVSFGCGQYVCYGSLAANSNQNVMGVHGDSGGPVYGYNADGRVRAKGIISSGWPFAYTTCPSTAHPSGPDCYYAIAYVGINPLLSFWGVDIETSS